ncbi:MAG TPA: glycosyltransferase 87 family protein [Acetobacteraceae bacterium]|nr:glycosyltransferase 87 family protein [Acetobacteraceae bacterium]
MKRLIALGAVLLALTLAALALHVPGAGTVGSPARNTALVILLLIGTAVYFATVCLILRRPLPRQSIWVVLIFAVALRVPVLIAPPFLSTDVLRYVWDGRVQANGINPYRYIPDDPALTALRDEAVYPHINRADYAPTIYPPAAQAIFAAVGTVSSTVGAMKLAMEGFEVLTVVCLLRLLSAARLPSVRVLIYAWNPLVVWAFAGNGHVDAAATGLLAAAMLLRLAARDTLAGVILGAAALTKFLPAIVAPALWRARAGWRLAVAALVTILLLYAIYIGVGWKVFGFLSGYGREEGLDSGTGIWLLAGLGRLIHLPPHATAIYFGAVLLGLVVLGAWIAFRRRPPIGSPDDAIRICGDTATLMACVMVAISPHYPWYFAWLALPAVLTPYPAVVWLSATPVLLYLDTHGDRFGWPSIIFAPAILLALWQLRRPRLASPAVPMEGHA